MYFSGETSYLNEFQAIAYTYVCLFSERDECSSLLKDGLSDCRRVPSTLRVYVRKRLRLPACSKSEL
jgi:hypothetical protein